MMSAAHKDISGPMTNSFSELVADYLQDIAHALRHPELVTMPRAGIPSAAPVERIEERADVNADPAGVEATLPRANVARLADGSHFVEDEMNEPAAYFIFTRQDSQAAFRYRTTLDPTMEPSRFIDSAYLAILERGADEAGRGNYVMMLREGYLTPAELIKTLAASDEFLNRASRMVVVPDGSQWLMRLSAEPKTLEIRPAMDA